MKSNGIGCLITFVGALLISLGFILAWHGHDSLLGVAVFSLLVLIPIGAILIAIDPRTAAEKIDLEQMNERDEKKKRIKKLRREVRRQQREQRKSHKS